MNQTQISNIGFALPKTDYALLMQSATADNEGASAFMNSAYTRENKVEDEDWISMFWPNVKWDERTKGHKFIKDYLFFNGNKEYQFLKINAPGSKKVQIEWHNTTDLEPLFPIGSWL